MVHDPAETFIRLAGPGKRIYLIEKNDASAFGLGDLTRFIKNTFHPRGPCPDIHADKFAPRNGYEREPRRGGHGLGQICFAAARRAEHHNAFDDLAADGFQEFSVFQKFYDLPGFFLNIAHADNVFPFHVDFVA